MKPQINELPVVPNMTIVAFTDGFLEAGERYGQKMSLSQVWPVMNESASAKEKVDKLFNLACSLDQQRPDDDISVIVVTIMPDEVDFPVRTLNISIPI
ncbi:MAG: SpoIIE family protein phosphatase [Clostridia bacterium]|nr:SpoIIE family protein phosphatase [Clostridia bacterium]